MRRGDVIARRVVHDGQLTEDVARIEKRKNRVHAIGASDGDLHDADFEGKNLVARIACEIDALPARHLEHSRHLVDIAFLEIGQGIQHSEVLEVPELRVHWHTNEYMRAGESMEQLPPTAPTA